MIVIDSSAFIAYFNGDTSDVTEKVDVLLGTNHGALAPVVLVELLSAPKLEEEVGYNLSALPLLEPKIGYWKRAGLTRSILLRKKLKARLADTLIAQICIDYNLPLLTLDKDFKSFVKYCGLKLI